MKTIVTIMALSLATAFSANAQTGKKVDKTATQTQATKSQPQQDLSKQVQLQTDRMTRELELTPEQAEEVMSENKALYSDMHSMSMDNLNAQDQERMSTRTIDNYDSNLESILDEGQYKRYQSMKAEYMKGFGSTAKVTKMDKKNEMLEKE